MGNAAKQKLIGILKDWLDELLPQLTGAPDDLAEWYRLRAEIHRRQSRILGIVYDQDLHKADFEANLGALCEALGKIGRGVKGKIRKLCTEYMIALINEWNKNDLPTFLANTIKVYQEILDLLRRYKKRLSPDTDLWAVVERCLLPSILALPRELLESDPLFQPFRDDARALSAVETLESELYNLFRINLLDANPGLFETNAAVLERLNGEIEGLKGEADAIRRTVIERLSNVAGLIGRLAEFEGELTPAEAREAVKKSVIAPLTSIPERYFPEGLPDTTKNLKTILKHEGADIGEAVEKRIWEQLRESDDELFPAMEEASHPCGAPCRSQEGRCHRPTTEEFCYQHGDAPEAAALAMVGKWRMSGSQSGIEHSGWEAELELDKSGSARWHQTAGANAGARRSGRWQWSRGVFTLVYRAPHTGRVEWEGRMPLPQGRSMGGEYRTPQVSPEGLGWGGNWSAVRVA